MDEKTKAVYCESIGNPAGNIIDLERVAELAHAQRCPYVIVDVPSRLQCCVNPLSLVLTVL
ncbi:PLP-dependent transferase [Vibrio chagasii]|nr:PLP-dependent transferase [Vibrio chagasii]